MAKKEKQPKEDKAAKKKKAKEAKDAKKKNKGKRKKGKKGEEAAESTKTITIRVYPGMTRRSFILKPLMRVVAFFVTARRKLSIKKIRMARVKPPYILLCSHQSFADYLVVERVTYPHDVNHLVEASEFANGESLMKSLGCIPLRRFSADAQLLYHIRETIAQKKIVAIYPEAHLSLSGTNSPLPDSLFKMLKTLKTPVVVVKIHGNYITHPSWSKFSNKASIEAVVSQVLSAEELNIMEPEDIGAKILSAFAYDEYWWQLQTNVRFTSKQRAEGLHHILYHCPRCTKEYQMNSHDDIIYCEHCGQEWTYDEIGNLSPVENTVNPDVLVQIHEAEREAAQKRFDAQRMDEAQKEYIQKKRAYDYMVRQRAQLLMDREDEIKEARQRLEEPPEFEPLPELPPMPTPVTKLDFVPVEMPEEEDLLPTLTRVPHWYEYERERVKEMVSQDDYVMEIPVQIEVLRNLQYDFLPLGNGILRHSAAGFLLLYKDWTGKDCTVAKNPLSTYSLHVDFDYKGKGPFIDISTENETFYLYPNTSDCSVTKVALAAEEMYKIARKLMLEQQSILDAQAAVSTTMNTMKKTGALPAEK